MTIVLLTESKVGLGLHLEIIVTQTRESRLRP